MAFNPLQFKKKKKRAVNPDAPPRPNLMSHDKKLREQTEAVDRLLQLVKSQQSEIDRLKSEYRNIQTSVEQIINVLRRGK